MAILELVKKKLFSGHERSVRAKKNVLALFVIRGGNVLINLALIPVTLRILDDYNYGVWITIFNVLAWVQIFDIGIGNGLRNNLTISLAKKDFVNAQKFVSTAYITVFLVSVIVILIFLIPWNFISWHKVFGVSFQMEVQLFYLIGTTFLFTVLQFSLNLISTILSADQKPAFGALTLTIANTITLALLIFFGGYIKHNLLFIGVLYTAVPLIVFSIISLWLFNSNYNFLKPRLIYFDFTKIRQLLNIGSHFFIIQIAVLVLFQTDTLIISHLFSPNDVTKYNILLRYFSILTMVANILMAPLWSAYTEAHSQKDYTWIKSTLRQQFTFFLFFIAFAIILCFCAPILIPYWINKNLNLNSTFIVLMALFSLTSIWNNIFSFFLNGVGKFKVQTITSIIATVINVPLSIFLSIYLGLNGIVLATIISMLVFSFFGAFTSFKYLKTIEPAR